MENEESDDKSCHVQEAFQVQVDALGWCARGLMAGGEGDLLLVGWWSAPRYYGRAPEVPRSTWTTGEKSIHYLLDFLNFCIKEYFWDNWGK